jgi:hypothetical protein
MECCGVVISVDRHHRRRALGRVASGSSCITRGAARPKAAKTVVGMAATPRTAILAGDRSVNKPHSSVVLQPQSSQFKLCIAAHLTLLIEKPLDNIQAVTKGDIKCYGAGGKRWIMVDVMDAGSRELT